MAIFVSRIASYVEVESMRNGPRLELMRDEPGVCDHGRRNPPGYVTVSLSDQAIFSVAALRRALDEYEAEVRS